MSAVNGLGGPTALPTRTTAPAAAPAETPAPATTNAPATQAPGDQFERTKPPTDEDKAAQAEGFADAEEKKMVDQWWEKRTATQIWDRILESFKDSKK